MELEVVLTGIGPVLEFALTRVRWYVWFIALRLEKKNRPALRRGGHVGIEDAYLILAAAFDAARNWQYLSVPSPIAHGISRGSAPFFCISTAAFVRFDTFTATQPETEKIAEIITIAIAFNFFSSSIFFLS